VIRLKLLLHLKTNIVKRIPLVAVVPLVIAKLGKLLPFVKVLVMHPANFIHVIVAVVNVYIVELGRLKLVTIPTQIAAISAADLPLNVINV
jgi:hypothetical protein